MYQFTKELIVNADIISAVSTVSVNVEKGGLFKTAEVVSCFKHPYAAPVKEKLVTTITITPAVEKIYRLVIDLKKVDSYTSDYTNDLGYNALNKIYEVTGVSAVDALAEAFKKAIKKDSYISDNVYITASASGAILTLNCTNEFQRFVKVELQEVKEDSLTGYDSYIVKQNLLEGDLTEGVVGFGTVSFITRNLRLPTLANTHYLAINQDERPVAGGQYTQYSIRLKTDRGPMGMSVVGQHVESTTDHIFYVISTQVAAWDTALSTAGIDVVEIP